MKKRILTPPPSGGLAERLALANLNAERACKLKKLLAQGGRDIGSPNRFESAGNGTILMHMEKGFSVLFDERDLIAVSTRKWRPFKHPKAKTVYAVSDMKDPSGKKIGEHKFHRVILGVKGRANKVDHRNHNGLDNRRLNIRKCKHSGNMRNQSLRTITSTGFKGVSPYRDGRFRARIQVRSRGIHLGYFTLPVEAAKAYDRAATRLFGKYALTNKAMGLLS
jgi:hypothetical protein